MLRRLNERYDATTTPLLDEAPVDVTHRPHEAEGNQGRAQQPRCAANEDTERALNYILTDCFFSLGQGVANNKSIDHAAVIWIHDHYHAQFFQTITMFGNRWLQDRHRVKGVSRMLGERSAYYAADKRSIDLAAVLRAAADVKRYCTLRAWRRRRCSGNPWEGNQPLRQAGSWCDDGPLPDPDRA